MVKVTVKSRLWPHLRSTTVNLKWDDIEAGCNDRGEWDLITALARKKFPFIIDNDQWVRLAQKQLNAQPKVPIHSSGWANKTARPSVTEAFTEVWENYNCTVCSLCMRLFENLCSLILNWTECLRNLIAAQTKKTRAAGENNAWQRKEHIQYRTAPHDVCYKEKLQQGKSNKANNTRLWYSRHIDMYIHAFISL